VRIENTGVSVLVVMYADCRDAKATSNIHIYCIVNADQIIEQYKDGGECVAGRRLLNLIQARDVKNQLTTVIRWYGGTNPGPSRFNHLL